MPSGSLTARFFKTMWSDKYTLKQKIKRLRELERQQTEIILKEMNDVEDELVTVSQKVKRWKR